MTGVRLRTLTPLWTGDVDRHCSGVKETGLVGSLRWWTEAVLRGMNEFACDPTEEYSRCPKSKENNLNIPFYCVSCLIFGATGLRKTFKFSVNGGEKIFGGGSIKMLPKGRARGWFLGSGLEGSLDLNLIPLGSEFNENLVLVPLAVASNWGGIGAKTQLGYGVVALEDSSEITIRNFEDSLKKLKELKFSKNLELRKENNNPLPNIKEMFFAKIQFKTDRDWWREVDGIKGVLEKDDRLAKWISSGSVPVAPIIKNWLRYGDGQKFWKTRDQYKDKRIENWLFGTTARVHRICFNKVNEDKNKRDRYWCPNCKSSLIDKNTFERLSSKVNVSHAYPSQDNKWEFRIWGWIPKDSLQKEFNRESFLDRLKGSLDGSGSVKTWKDLFGNLTLGHQLKVWREFDSSRDSVKPNEEMIESYLQSLLNYGEEGQ